jgi:M6 family metalloprotease-like protein
MLGAMCVHTDLAAMPPHPDVIKALRERGDTAGLARMKARAENQARRGINRIKAAAPALGPYRVLVLLIDYPDRNFNGGSNVTFYSNLLNGSSPTALSMKKYYEDMSGGLFNLTIDVRWPYRALYNASYYGGNDSSGDDRRPASLVREAVNAAKNAGVNFAPYDNNDDGEVDVVVVVHAGPGEEFSENANDIWSHAWQISGDGAGSVSVSGKIADVYCIQPEFIQAPLDSTIGVFCHEFGHILGLPDLYDTTNATEGAGIFTVMAGGAWAGPGSRGGCPTPFLAWEKAMLGWITVKDPKGDVVYLVTYSMKAPAFAQGMFPDAKRPAAPVSYAVLLIGLLASGGGCVWYARKGKAAALVLAVICIIAAAMGGINCSELEAWLGEDSSSFSASVPSGVSSSSSVSSGTVGSSSSTSAVTQVSLSDIEETREAIMIPLGDPAGKQYYLVENKVVKNGTWTQYFPGSGLLITHIHDAVISAKIDLNTVNDGASRIHGVNIVEADNGNHLWSGVNDGRAADLFQNRRFDPNQSPSTFYYTGTSPNWLASGKAASKVYLNIGAAGQTMTFTYENK